MKVIIFCLSRDYEPTSCGFGNCHRWIYNEEVQTECSRSNQDLHWNISSCFLHDAYSVFPAV